MNCLLTIYRICSIIQELQERVFFRSTATEKGLLFLTNALIDQNYIVVVVMLISFISGTEPDIRSSFLEYIVSVRLKTI